MRRAENRTDGGSSAAEIQTEFGSPDRAERIAAAVAPDNTAEMTTRVEGEQVVTTIERDTTNGLQSTVDDYVVNLRVAAQLTTDPTQSNHE
jgi:tRNA threonylcarbamoyladenosine modification (KEOPS) complex  Pcc1 subunit